MKSGYRRIPFLLLVLAASGYAKADRLLLEDQNVSVTVVGVHFCGQPVTVAVNADSPDLFGGESAALQRIVDGSRAMLGFECASLREIEVQGRLKGLGTNVYRGIATRDSQWRLDTLESIRSKDDRGSPGGVVGAVVGEGTSATKGSAAALEVAGLSTGMTVEEASAAVRETFGAEPGYDAAQGLLTLNDGGCPPDYDPVAASHDPRAGWKCLRAWFTDQRQPRLYRMELVQVVGESDEASVVRIFEGRFGSPVASWTESRREGGARGKMREVMHLAWGREIGTAAASGARPARAAHELEAEIRSNKDLVVTRVVRDDPAQQPASAQTPRADLKL